MTGLSEKKKKKKSAPHKQKTENTSSWSMSTDRCKAPPLLRWNKVVNMKARATSTEIKAYFFIL